MVDIFFGTIVFLMILGIAGSVVHLRYLSKADIFISIFLFLGIVVESCSTYLTFVYRNDLVAYNIYTPLELFTLSLYFNESIKSFKDRHVGIYTGVAGILIAVVNVLFIQRWNSVNSVFLMYEALCIISMCIAAFYYMVKDEHRQLRKSVHFWVTTILLIYWSFSFVHWSMFEMLTKGFVTSANFVWDYVLWFANLGMYGGLAMIFLRYRKMIPSGE